MLEKHSGYSYREKLAIDIVAWIKDIRVTILARFHHSPDVSKCGVNSVQKTKT